MNLHRPTRRLAAALVALPLLAGAPAALADALLDFKSNEGTARLAEASAQADFTALRDHFEGQPNEVFCGPTSAAVVLNALHRRADGSRPRFTPESVVAKGRKTRAQVFGEPVRFGGRMIRDYGYQLHQLAELLEGNGAQVKKVVVSDSLAEDAIRADLTRNLRTGGDYVIVNYLRKAVGQPGGGHISPLAAYDAASDSFLVLDVNPAVADWVWMPARTLIAGMRTFDTIENRGYLLVTLPDRSSSRTRN